MTSPRRRTQAERRSTTRLALLAAALDCLVDRGVAGVTTTEVCRRAGLSQGALFKHFGTKHDLWSATIEHLFDGLRHDWEARFTALAPEERTLEEGIELLWREMHDPRLAAAYELYAVARTDPELRAALDPVVRAHVHRLFELADVVRPPTGPGADDYAAVVDLFVLAVQGLVLQEMAVPDAAKSDRLRATMHALTGLLVHGGVPA
jgi:AcrR family transcriptional regulator